MSDGKATSEAMHQPALSSTHEERGDSQVEASQGFDWNLTGP